ncbi:hypothetical protein PT974_12258 [Cladobotryum mycophilum]|uniref:Tat pathway signal sequence n=1 Tax=Cladobotryum mycophilum TaxID=491253 RepID=A0ABR0S7H3_9HYPO
MFVLTIVYSVEFTFTFSMTPPAQASTANHADTEGEISNSSTTDNARSTTPRIFANVDVPLPSTEEAPEDSPNKHYKASSENRFTSSPSPSIVFTPSSSATSRHGSVINDLQIFSPNPLGMNELATAVDRVADGSDKIVAHLEPESQTPGRSPGASRRRRSGSNINSVPHRVEDEEAPPEPFHEASFQRCFMDTKSLASDLKETLGNSSLHQDPDSMMRRLHSEAERLASFQCPSTRTVGFVGDSGVGKSSLLNSLLDYRGLARTSNSGAACTCVVTEYHYHAADNFAVEVETFSIEDINTQIKELLRSFRHYHLQQNDLDAGEREDFEQRANVARDTFRAMFGPRLNGDQFLLLESESVVLDSVLSWVREVFPSTVSGRHVNSSLAECSDRLMRLTSEVSGNSQPSVWPFIRKIKVFSRAHILSKGLVLVDLPGNLRDLNSARQNITERYLLECDQVFAICNIGRATTDVGVSSVFDLANRARLSQVGIICTKADDIRAEEAKKDWKDERSRKVGKFMTDIAVEKSELRELQKMLDEEDWSDDEEEMEVTRDERQKRKSIEKMQLDLKGFLMTTRNDIVIKGLKDLYKNKVPRGMLQVFCVSNTDYWKHREDNKDGFLPFLELSGIKAVRKHCISIVADSQLRIATKYIQKDVPAFLADVELWVQSGAGNMGAEQKAIIRQALDNVESRLQRGLLERDSAMSKAGKTMKDEFKQRIFDERQTTSWSQEANSACSEWSDWHHSSYAAFVRQSGDHYTPTVGQRNWNEEAMEKMVSDVSEPYRNLCNMAGSQGSDLTDLIENLADWANEFIETEIGEISPSSTTLIEAVDSRSQQMAADVEDICTKFGSDLSLLETDALSSIRSSIFGKAMEEGYRSARHESGAGSDRRRKAIIRGTVGPERLFVNHMNEFKKRFDDLAKDFQEELKTKIEAHMNVIKETLDIIRNENVALESEQDPGFRRRVEAGVREAREKMREIQETVSGRASS